MFNNCLKLCSLSVFIAVFAATLPISVAAEPVRLSDQLASQSGSQIGSRLASQIGSRLPNLLQTRTDRPQEKAQKQAQKQARRRRRPRPPRTLPPNRVQPGGGLDAAAQSCEAARLPLTALLPKENPVLTASAYPTFLFYLSDSPDRVSYAEFILLSADEKEEIYSTQFTPLSEGMISVSLPEDPEYALETDQVYHWYFNLHCQQTSEANQSSSPTVPAVNGWVKRTSGEVSQLDENGLPVIWYDAIAQLAETLSTNSESLQEVQQWNAWLSAIGLGDIAETIDPEAAISY